MYIECRDYLVGLIKSAGLKREVHTNQKTLDADNESHKAAVIADTDEQKPNGKKVKYVDADGRKHKRTKKFDRSLTFIVTIGDYNYEQVEAVYERLLSLIDPGIWINDNYTGITLQPGTWFDDEDKIIKSKAAVVFKIKFDGGVYVDTDYLKIGIDVEVPEKGRKEE